VKVTQQECSAFVAAPEIGGITIIFVGVEDAVLVEVGSEVTVLVTVFSLEVVVVVGVAVVLDVVEVNCAAC
jgi:hypothetical protein